MEGNKVHIIYSHTRTTRQTDLTWWMWLPSDVSWIFIGICTCHGYLPFSTMSHYYHGRGFYWWTLEYFVKTTDMQQLMNKLFYINLYLVHLPCMRRELKSLLVNVLIVYVDVIQLTYYHGHDNPGDIIKLEILQGIKPDIADCK